MRYLNKIIFINSANVPYSEVLLDGNVHFGGTQGVGKSTVLRAILFFYTADQKHLGIQLRQKSFEEFYFPKINSYIIYEVKALHGFYTILLRRSGGKIEFRFIDAPYRMEWFIGENRRAEHDWTRIRSNIGNNIDISAKVDTFEQYRNIIFGNIRDSRHSFDKYAIVESTRYQNIPRSIQNVFLNSKLDADFVKNTIINSMTDDEDFIDLSAYRPQMEDFDREFVEVSCWFSKDSKGNIPVRMKADKVIDIYRLIMALKQEMLQTWHRMNYAVGHSRNQIPLVEDKIVVLEDGIIRLDEKLENCRKDYNKEHDSLREKIGEVNSILKQIRLKRKEYDDINIRDILARDAECPRLMNERSRKTQLLNSLEAKFSDIAEKYRRVRQSLEDGWNSFVQVQKAELQQLRDEQQSQRDRMAGLSDKRKADIDRVYSEWLAESDGRMDSLRAEYNRTDKRLSELKFWHPKQTEIDNVKEEILELGVEQSKLQSELSAVHNDLKVIRQEYRMLEEQLTNDHASRTKADANRMESEELKGKGADTEAIRNCRLEIKTIDEKLALIEKQRHYIYEYRKDEKELFSREPEYKDRKQELEARDESVSKNYEDRRLKLLNEKSENANALGAETKRLESLKDGLRQYELLLTVENIVPDELRQDEREEKNKVPCSDLVAEMRGAINRSSMARDDLKRAVNAFNTHFGVNNTFRFIIPQYDEDYMDFAVNLLEFVDNNKIEVYRMRMSEHYSNILTSISREIGMLMNHTSDIRKIINDVNNDFRERNFAGVIRSIELKIDESSDQMMQLLRTINEFVAEKDLSLGAVNLFSEGDTDRVNLKAVEYLRRFMRQLQKDNARTRLTLSDTFTLKFRVVENDNDTGWQEKISNVGSDGTDILVKAMVNIMLINVFKQKAARKNGDFIIHCMMDEIGKLHPNNVDGILRFANVRNIYLINSSPMSYNADSYRYNYLLEKDSKS